MNELRTHSTFSAKAVRIPEAFETTNAAKQLTSKNALPSTLV